MTYMIIKTRLIYGLPGWSIYASTHDGQDYVVDDLQSVHSCWKRLISLIRRARYKNNWLGQGGGWNWDYIIAQPDVKVVRHGQYEGV